MCLKAIPSPRCLAPYHAIAQLGGYGRLLGRNLGIDILRGTPARQGTPSLVWPMKQRKPIDWRQIMRLVFANFILGSISKIILHFTGRAFLWHRFSKTSIRPGTISRAHQLTGTCKRNPISINYYLFNFSQSRRVIS